MMLSDSQISSFYGSEVFGTINQHVDISNLPILEEEEYLAPETKYLVMQCNPEVPPAEVYPNIATGIIPPHENFPGQFNFEYLLNPPTKSKSYVYSSRLKKIFIDMEHRLSIRFQWTPLCGEFFVRAMVIYADDQHRSVPVVRCHNHKEMQSPANQGVDSFTQRHVIRCDHNQSAYQERGGHLSVVVPLGHAELGCRYVPLDFQFYCKNSCSSGMNRRATEIIFTLETINGEVVGRRILPCRVCSCPKRDKEKEEQEQLEGAKPTKKRKATPAILGANLPPGKKFANQCLADTTEFKLELRVPGFGNARQVLKMAYDIIAGDAIRNSNYKKAQPYLDELEKKLNNLTPMCQS